MNKKVCAFLIISSFSFLAHAGSYDPHSSAGERSPQLRCIGDNADYPLAFISYAGDDRFTVTVNEDLDVPGGAIGSVSWPAVGKITTSAIDLTIEGDAPINKIQGPWINNYYLTSISGNTYRCIAVP